MTQTLHVAAVSDLPALADAIRTSMRSAPIATAAGAAVALARAHGLESDWETSPEKVSDFAALVVAAQSVLGPGGTIETGVCKGGTSGVLIASAPKEAFHIAIDPYGLPTQSYPNREKYGRWPQVRGTLSGLTRLGVDHGVTVCPYVMSSQAFAGGDLLRDHPGLFRIVHLDGDHSRDAVVTELEFFRRRITGPALFILDDHDEHFPGVEEGLQAAGRGLVRVLHNTYAFDGYGIAGFSAWLQRGG